MNSPKEVEIKIDPKYLKVASLEMLVDQEITYINEKLREFVFSVDAYDETKCGVYKGDDFDRAIKTGTLEQIYQWALGFNYALDYLGMLREVDELVPSSH
jgi:hypothetical protein